MESRFTQLSDSYAAPPILSKKVWICMRHEVQYHPTIGRKSVQMEMPREQTDKLKRYLINADPFLWGVLEKRNKKERLEEIKKLGFLKNYSQGSNPTYNKVNQDLLVELGIEGILKYIVVRKVRDRINREVRWKSDIIPFFKKMSPI